MITSLSGLLLLGGCATNRNGLSELEERIASAENSYQLGLLSDAEAKFIRILEDHPDLSDAWLKLGNVYVRTGQLEAAVRAYTTCIKTNTENGKCWNNLAVVRVRQAIAGLEEGVSAVPQGSSEQEAIRQFYYELVKTISTAK